MLGGEIKVELQSPTWSPPSRQTVRPQPVTLQDGLSYAPEYGQTSPWDPSAMSMHGAANDSMARPLPMYPHDYFAVDELENNPWAIHGCDDNVQVQSVGSDMGHVGQAYATDETFSLMDMRYAKAGPSMNPNSNHPGNMSLNLEPGQQARRLSGSGSSFAISASAAISDMSSYDGYSTTLSEAPSYSSDYPPLSNHNSMMSATQLSPVLSSPRRIELGRAASRGRAGSPSPRPTVRSAPYNIDSSARNKRWSTGSYGTGPHRRSSPLVYPHPHPQDAYNAAQMSSRHSSPTISHQGLPNHGLPLNYCNLQAAQQHPFLLQQPAPYRSNMLLPAQLPSPAFHHHDAHLHYEQPAPLLPHGVFRMLQSNGDPHSIHAHYTDLSDPPDLYGSLGEEQIPPPPEDMDPSDPDLVPHEQELRFEGDLYTPRWVRGHGNKREGWCGICKPGRWLVLKNSAFWYDKSFTHGISAATGQPFQEPRETRRMDGNPDVWEGLCGSCDDWIALVSSKKKGTTWFRHAYKCHTHPKIKDAPKRRRESSHSRALAASSTAKPKAVVEPRAPMTPQMTPSAPLPMAHTPTSPMPPITAQSSMLQAPAPLQSSPQRSITVLGPLPHMV